MHFEQPFLDALARFHAHESARRAINLWVDRQTHARIPALLAPGTPTVDSRLVLVNAVHLKADWMFPFQTAQTTQASFQTPAAG